MIMKERFRFLLFITLLVLSSIHFNWALGNEWGLNNALPTDSNGYAVLQPTVIDTLIVAFGLLFFALFYFSQNRYSFIKPPRWINLILGWFIPTIFLIRSIGDFNYVGFFKRVKTTDFAQMDSMLYSPLCLIIFILALIVIRYD